MNDEFLSSEERRALAYIAIHRVYEPYEFYLTSQTLRKAGVKLGKTVDKIKSVAGNLGDSFDSMLGKVGKQYQSATNRISEEHRALKQKSAQVNKTSEEFVAFTEEFNKKFKSLVSGLPGKNKQIQSKVKEKYNQIYNSLIERQEYFVNKIFNALIRRYSQEYILAKGQSVFPKKDLRNPDDFNSLTQSERKKLLEVFYLLKVPYWESFNTALIKFTNLSLGLVSQIPMVGALVGVVNMIKTLVQLSKSICDHSASYGRAPASVQSLHYLSFMILKSMNSFELDSNHVPMDFKIIESLYDKEIKFNIQDIFKQMIIKDAYISVPVVGVLSLKKIDFDDFKQELKIKTLFQDYFKYKNLSKCHSEDKLSELLNLFADECRTIRNSDFLEKLPKQFENKGNQFKEYIFENHKFAGFARSRICDKIIRRKST